MKFLSLVSVVPVTPSVISPVSDSRSSKSPTSRSSPSSTARRKDQDHKSIRYLLINHGRIKIVSRVYSFRMSVLSDSVSMTAETQNSTDFFSPTTSIDSSTESVTSTIQTGDEFTSSVTDGDLVSSVETEPTSESEEQSYITTFSESYASSNESDSRSYTSFEKARFTFSL